jgi:hypothetical protein
MGWSKNEFSHSLSLEPAPVGAVNSAAACLTSAARRGSVLGC